MNLINELLINHKKFKNKNVIITGAGSGYGRALAICFCLLKSNVILIGRNKEKLEQSIKIAKSLTKKSLNYLVLPCDITKEKELDKCFKKIKKNYRSIDILISWNIRIRNRIRVDLRTYNFLLTSFYNSFICLTSYNRRI